MSPENQNDWAKNAANLLLDLSQNPLPLNRFLPTQMEAYLIKHGLGPSRPVASAKVSDILDFEQCIDLAGARCTLIANLVICASRGSAPTVFREHFLLFERTVKRLGVSESRGWFHPLVESQQPAPAKPTDRELLETMARETAGADTHIRNVAKKYLPAEMVDGDSLGVPPIERVVDMLVEKIKPLGDPKDYQWVWAREGKHYGIENGRPFSKHHWVGESIPEGEIDGVIQKLSTKKFYIIVSDGYDDTWNEEVLWKNKILSANKEQ